MSKARGGLGRGLSSLFGDTQIFDPKPESIDPKEAEEKSGDEKLIEGIKSLSKASPAKEDAAGAKAGTAADPKAGAAAGSEAEGLEGADSEALSASGERVVYINLSDIKPNSKQPRKSFSEDSLEELANSIMEYGVIQPVLLRPAAVGYELVAGERRWRAARKAGLKEIPAIIRDLDDRQNAFYALIENMQREDLNSIEEAEGIQKMIQDFGLSQDEAAKAVGKSRSYVSNALRLLKLPEEVRSMVVSGTLSAGHARAIASLAGPQLQLEAAKKAAEEDWSVRKTESYTGAKTKRAKGKNARTRKSADIKRVEEELSEALGTKISIKGSEVKGQIVLSYFSRDELERLIELLKES